MRWSLLAMLATSIGCSSDVAFECPDGAPLCDIVEITADSRRAARGIIVTRVALIQGVHTDIMNAGTVTEPEVPIVANREAIFRIFVLPEPGYLPRQITARVTLYRDGEVVGAAQEEMRPAAISEMDIMGTTFNVRVPGTMMLPGELEYEVELLEAKGARPPAGDSSQSRFPLKGALPATLDVQDGGDSLQVYLVPVSWDNDGSGQLPDTGEVALEQFRNYLYAIFPVGEVEIEVAEPMPWPHRSTITSQTLQAIASLREERDVPSEQYIYGLLNPSIGSGGGAAGLSFLAGRPLDAGQRASIGLSMAEGAGASTMAHEIGHAHGRSHSPCGGAAGPDPEYPHEGASIGTYGYDLINDKLKGPESHLDLMSYCDPEWVSDYNFDLFFQRQQGIFEEVLGGPDGTARVGRQAWRRIWLHTDGEVRDGGIAWLSDTPDGDDRIVQIDGESVRGKLAPFSHVDGGVLYVPVEEPFTTIRLDDGIVYPVLEGPLR